MAESGCLKDGHFHNLEVTGRVRIPKFEAPAALVENIATQVGSEPSLTTGILNTLNVPVPATGFSGLAITKNTYTPQGQPTVPDANKTVIKQTDANGGDVYTDWFVEIGDGNKLVMGNEHAGTALTITDGENPGRQQPGGTLRSDLGVDPGDGVLVAESAQEKISLINEYGNANAVGDISGNPDPTEHLGAVALVSGSGGIDINARQDIFMVGKTVDINSKALPPTVDTSGLGAQDGVRGFIAIETGEIASEDSDPFDGTGLPVLGGNGAHNDEILIQNHLGTGVIDAINILASQGGINISAAAGAPASEKQITVQGGKLNIHSRSVAGATGVGIAEAVKIETSTNSLQCVNDTLLITNVEGTGTGTGGGGGPAIKISAERGDIEIKGEEGIKFICGSGKDIDLPTNINYTSAPALATGTNAVPGDPVAFIKFKMGNGNILVPYWNA